MREDESRQREIEQLDYYRKIEIEQQFYYDYCLIPPTEQEVDSFLLRFGSLPTHQDKVNAILESKRWGNQILTSKMQQLL